jgi:hypothetical protein
MPGTENRRASPSATRVPLVSRRSLIERNLFAPRWQATPQRERKYLVAVAEVLAAWGEARGGDVARHLGLATSQLSYYWRSST